jgi:hypothetical protein
VKIGIVTGGRTDTVVDDEADDTLQPFAVTVIVAVPEKPASQVTIPVVPVPEIVFSAPVIVQL